MASETRLTPTSYIVLGLVELLGETTPYALKQAAAAGPGNFWSLQHAQLYSEPERLAAAGLLSERREEEGRRRRHYTITSAGREALDAWRATPADRIFELRDLALLKLFFGADPRIMAEAQLRIHRETLARYEAMPIDSIPHGPRLTLEMGIRHQRTSIAFWEDVLSR